MKLFVLFLILSIGSTIARSSSSSIESCEDSHDHGHGHHHHHSESHEHGGGGGGANRGCPRGWHSFNRPSGGWCIKVFRGQAGHSQASAQAQCQAQGATLSGLQNEAEIFHITASAIKLFPERTGSLWIGARRTARCARSRLTSSCNKQNTFVWTDNSATGTTGFRWSGNQPDNSNPRTQQCAVVLASGEPMERGWNWSSNYLDDVSCESPGGSYQRTVRGYVCGKRVTRD